MSKPPGIEELLGLLEDVPRLVGASKAAVHDSRNGTLTALDLLEVGLLGEDKEGYTQQLVDMDPRRDGCGGRGRGDDADAALEQAQHVVRRLRVHAPRDQQIR